MSEDEKKELIKRLVNQFTEKQRESFQIRKELADNPNAGIKNERRNFYL